MHLTLKFCKMPQQKLIVRRELVDGLVLEFMKSYKGRTGRYCSSFDSLAIYTALTSLPDNDGYVDYHAASRVLDKFECNKLTAFCNSWTPWMRNCLKQSKIKL